MIDIIIISMSKMIISLIRLDYERMGCMENNSTQVFIPESTKQLLQYLADPKIKGFLSLLSQENVGIAAITKQCNQPKAKKENRAVDSHGRKTGLKSNGIPVAHEADSIKDINIIRQIQDYFLTQTSVRDYALFTLGICFGLRIGDLLSLHFYDLMDSKTTFKKYLKIHEDKTDKLNKIAITDLAVKTLQKYIDYLTVTEGDFKLTDYLFRSRKGRQSNDTYDEEGQSPLTVQRAWQIFKGAAKALSLDFNFSTHTLRKTFSYWSIKLNEGDTESLYTLQAALNHSDARTTLKYAGITQENVDKLRNDVSSVIEEAGTKEYRDIGVDTTSADTTKRISIADNELEDDSDSISDDEFNAPHSIFDDITEALNQKISELEELID